MLSAFGLNWIINFLAVTIMAIAIFLSFLSHYKIIKEDSPRFKMISVVDYQDLNFLAGLPKGIVLAYFEISMAVAPITGNETIGYFFDDLLGKKHVDEFFGNDDYDLRDALIKVYNVDYVISQQEISCGYKLLRSKHNYIYKIDNTGVK